MSPELSSFLVAFRFADLDGKQQLKSKVNNGEKSKPKRSVIPQRKQFSIGANGNTVRRSRFSLCNIDFS